LTITFYIIISVAELSIMPLILAETVPQSFL